jgi:low temperature requirement protein LtrA
VACSSAALWWAWAGYAWLTNTVDPDEGVVWGAMLVAMAAMFVAALAVPMRSAATRSFSGSHF